MKKEHQKSITICQKCKRVEWENCGNAWTVSQNGDLKELRRIQASKWKTC